MSDYVNAGRAKPRRKTVVWPYAVGLALALGWSILTLPAFIQGVAPYMTGEGMSSGRMFGYFAGHAFLQALVVWLLVNLPGIKWQGPHPLYFFALLAAAAAPEVASVKAAQARAAEYRYDPARTQTGMAELKSVLISVVRFGPQKDGGLDARARAVGEAGRVEAAWKRMAAGLEQDARACQGRMPQLSANGPLSSASLATSAGVEAAKARLAQAHSLIDQLAARADARFNAFEAEAARVAAGSGDRARVEGLAQKGRDTKQHLDALWAVERGILAEADGMVANPSAARAHRQRIETLAAREMQMQDDFRRETASATEESEAAAGN